MNASPAPARVYCLKNPTAAHRRTAAFREVFVQASTQGWTDFYTLVVQMRAIIPPEVAIRFHEKRRIIQRRGYWQRKGLVQENYPDPKPLPISQQIEVGRHYLIGRFLHEENRKGRAERKRVEGVTYWRAIT